MKISEKIKFSNLNTKDLKNFQKFIKKHWNKNHIYANDISFFNWQHKIKYNYNCIVAKSNKQILGVQAFIPQNQYDNKLPGNQIFLALFRCLANSKPGTGLLLYNSLINKYVPQFIGTTGFNSNMILFHKWQGFKIGQMNHYVALSPYKKKFNIALVPKNFQIRIKKKKKYINYQKINLKNIDNYVAKKIYSYQIPNKSNTFIKNRFMKHPIYKYLLYGSIINNKAQAICVFRVIKKSKRAVIKLVDFIGQNKFFPLFNNLFIDLIKKYSAEYIDFYSYGIKSNYIIKAGFINRKKYQKLIIPEYFEPFVKKNIDLMYGYKTSIKYPLVRLFKADGDRDRPSILKKLNKKVNNT